MRLILSTDFRSRVPRPFRRGKKGIFSIRMTIAGRNIWRSLGTTDKREAQYLALEIWRHQQSDIVRSIVPAAPVAVALLWSRYTDTDKCQLLAESTRKTRKKVFEAFVRFCNERRIKYINDISRDAVQQFLEATAGRGKAHTWNNRLSDLSSIFAAVPDIPNPCNGIAHRSTKRGDKASVPFRELSRAEIAQILWAIRRSHLTARREWFDACVVALNTGARFKDIALLRFSDVNADRKGNYLAFIPAKTAAKTGGKAVLFRPTAALTGLLQRRRRIVPAGDLVFPFLSERVDASSSTLNDFLHKRGITATFHCFRVTFITSAAREGVDLGDFGGVVGQNPEQTKAYNRAALDIDLTRITTFGKCSKK